LYGLTLRVDNDQRPTLKAADTACALAALCERPSPAFRRTNQASTKVVEKVNRMKRLRIVGWRPIFVLAGFALTTLAVVRLGLFSVATSAGALPSSKTSGSTIACTRDLSPPLAAKPSVLHAVTAIAARDVWSVGSEGGGAGRPLVEHYDGHSWRRADGIPLKQGALTDVTAISPSDIWAIGTTIDIVGKPVVIHWDGATWKRIALPSAVDGVDALSATKAAGVWLLASDNQTNGASIHWIGGRWNIVRAGLPRSPGYSPDDIAMVSPHEGWIVGSLPGLASIPAADAYRAYVGYWNGRRWRPVRTPSVLVGGVSGRGYGEEVASIAITGPHSLSAAAFAVSAGFHGVFVLDWDGTKWRSMRSPGGGGTGALFGAYGVGWESIAAGQQGEAWIVAREDTAAHRGNANWSLIPAADNLVDLHAVTAYGAGSAWAVGEISAGDPSDPFGRAVAERLECRG
jgi:hypothetical protein